MPNMYLYYTPYLILPLLSFAVSGTVAAYSWSHQKLPGVRPLLWLMISMAGWSLAYAVNTSAISLALKIVCFKLGTTFACPLGPAVLALALELTGRGAWLTRRRLALFCIIPGMSLLLVWSNEMHGLFRYGMHLQQNGALLLLGFKDGPYMPVHVLFIILCNLTAITLFANGLFRSSRRERPRFACLILATIIPVVVELLGITPVKWFSMTTSSLFLTGTLYAIAIFRHNLLELVPVARATILEIMSDPVFVVDKHGFLATCNRAARGLLQNSIKIKGLPIAAFVDIAPELASLVIEGKEKEGNFTLKRDPHLRCWHFTITQVGTKNDYHEGRIIVLRDITAQRKAEEELLTLNTTLQEQVEQETRRRVTQERLLANQSRLAAMGEMIGAIAHQWRQPLSTLGMIIQRTHATGTLQGLTKEYLDEFKSNAMRQVKYMSETIEEFRGFYRLEKQKELFSPVDCITDAIRLFEPQFISSGIKVEIICLHCARKMVHGFPNEFKQVILNLLANSRDAILDSRRSTGCPQEGYIGIAVSLTNNTLMHIDVSDNGGGISTDIAPKVFDPYFTTKDETGGTGIGLYMSRMIVEDSLEGRLNLLESTNGAAFRIELPLEEQT